MTKIYLCTEYGGGKRTIILRPGINEQDFLTLLCWHYEEAARFILDWASTGMDEASQFMATFLAHVYRDMNVGECYMKSRRPENPGLQSPGISVCNSAFQRFCELLHENSELVRIIRESPIYASFYNEDILGKRDSNWVSLTRGTSWQPSPSFKNPNPIPREILASFHQKQQEQKRRDEARGKQQEEEQARERARKKEEKTKERCRIVAIKQVERKEKSNQRKAFRDYFITLPVNSQLQILAMEKEIPITVFPIDHRNITNDALQQLDDFILTTLMERSSKRWEFWWKEFSEKIRKILQDRKAHTAEQSKHDLRQISA